MAETLRILMNAPSVHLGSPAAQNIHQTEFVRNLLEMGHEVCLIAGREEGGWGDRKKKVQEESEEIPGRIPDDAFVPVYSSKVPGNRLLFTLHSMRLVKKKIISFKPDIIHDRGYVFGGVGVLNANKSEIPSVIQIDDDWVLSESISSRIASTFVYERLALKWSSRIINMADAGFTVSKTLRDTVIEKYHARSSSIFVVPNGVDPNRFSPDVPPLGLRERYSIKGKMLIFVGALGPWHGVENLISAMGVLKRKKSQNITAVVVGGKNSDVIRYRELVKKMGLEKEVIFTGSISHAEVPSAIVEADVAVAPYPDIEFGFSPFKILEYMAVGKPVIASPLNSIKEILSSEEGILVECWDSEKFAEAIQNIVSDEKRIEEMGRRARKKVVERFTWRKATEKLLSVYRAVL